MRNSTQFLGLTTTGLLLAACAAEGGAPPVPADPNAAIAVICHEAGVVDQLTLVNKDNNRYRIDTIDGGHCVPVRLEHQESPPRTSEVIGGLTVGMEVDELCVESYQRPPGVVHISDYRYDIDGYVEARVWDQQDLPHCYPPEHQ